MTTDIELKKDMEITESEARKLNKEFIKIKTRTAKLIPLIEIFEIRLSRDGMRI